MSKIKLIADSGATKTEWRLIAGNKKKAIFTQGLSPYFLNRNQIAETVATGVMPAVKRYTIDEIYFCGTGCKTAANKAIVKAALRSVFSAAAVTVEDDVTGAAKSLCGREKGIACILGTGSNSCFFNGKKIVKNSPGIGFILGDEGSGAVLGKSLIQHYLYELMDESLRTAFDKKFQTNTTEILDAVYRKPLPNRYLASFVPFLAENRGHYMVENILEDGINQFFYTHLLRYREIMSYPVNFVGGVAYGFKDIVVSLCEAYGFHLGNIYKAPMEGLIKYHKED